MSGPRSSRGDRRSTWRSLLRELTLFAGDSLPDLHRGSGDEDYWRRVQRLEIAVAKARAAKP